MKKKILLVDDSHTVLLMERMILAKFPFDLITASSGEEAVAKIRAGHFSLVILDVDMPNLTGIEALKLIKDHDPSIIVIQAPINGIHAAALASGKSLSLPAAAA